MDHIYVDRRSVARVNFIITDYKFRASSKKKKAAAVASWLWRQSRLRASSCVYVYVYVYGSSVKDGEGWVGSVPLTSERVHIMP
jgi:hypothetical protein